MGHKMIIICVKISMLNHQLLARVDIYKYKTLDIRKPNC